MGFNMLFYIIFGTNLLTGGPVPVAVFLPNSVFRRKEYQTERNLHEDLSWNKRNPGDMEWKSKTQRGGHEAGGRAQGGRRAPTLMGSPGLFWTNSFTPGAYFGP